MAKTKQQIVKYFILILIGFFFVKCANQISPPGGEVDKNPPTIIYTYPENGTTNFRENEIEFGFSEYVNKRNITDAFFISPLIEGQPEYSWTNKTVYITIPDSLKENTTYSIIIGTEITDVNNNNKMIEPFTLTFSTGDQIDSGRISGKVYTDKADGTLIFAYKIDSLMPDIFTQKPLYLSQIDEKGFFKLGGLADGEYLLFAIKDEFKDLVYNIGNDLIGIPNRKIILSENNRDVKGNNYLLQKQDTLIPNIQVVTMTDKNHLVVEFSEPIDSIKLSIENFSIIDSTENKSYSANYWYRTNSKKNEYVICLSDSLPIDNSLYLICNNIYDKIGNRLLREITNFIASDKPDTVAINLSAVSTQYDKMIIDYLNPSFELDFSDAFNPTNIYKAISFYDKDSTRLSISIDFINSAAIKISTKDKLKQDSPFTINVDLNYIIDIAGNKKDTTIIKNISTIGELEFSGVSGIVKSKNDNVKVLLKQVGVSSKPTQVATEKNKSFNFKRVLPGKYLVWAYIDADSNNEYSYGNLEPFKYAEYFKYYPDTLNLRARWPVGDIEIDLLINEL